MTVQARLNVDTTGFVIYEYPASRKDDATFEQDAARAAVLAQFTLMASKPVTIPTTGTADVGNTGDGTVTAVAAAAGGVPVVGDYTLECTFAVANGGVFKLTDPNTNIVADNLTLRVGAGLLTTFVEAGMTFTVTDGATDFAAGDKFTITTTANGKLVPFDATAVDGSEIPVGIFMGEDITAAALVAGDVVDNPVVFNGMKFDEDKLVFDNGSDTLATVLSTGLTIRETLDKMTLIPQQTQTASAYENA
jgi:hypothetical protein